MNDNNYADEGEFDLYDVYEFLRNGWKAIAATTVLGGAFGLGVSFVLPEKYLASAIIQPAKLLGESVEGAPILSEKLRIPTYYSKQTLAECDLLDRPDPAEKLAKLLNSNVTKNSVFVSVSYKSSSIDISMACLNAVLENINYYHNIISKPQIELARLTNNEEKERLKSAENLVANFSNKILTFNFDDTQLLASQFLLSTQFSKQDEITALKYSIEKRELLLSEPHTKPASFVTPIYAQTQKVSPKPLFNSLSGFLAGGFIGLVFIILKNFSRYIQERIRKNEALNAK